MSCLCLAAACTSNAASPASPASTAYPVSTVSSRGEAEASGKFVPGAPKFTPVDPKHAPRNLNDAY